MKSQQVKNILIVGVGGQGTILAGRIISRVVENAGLTVKVSEVHGMSQRGGSVVTQVRFGKVVASPIIIPGMVDIIIAFEKLEALRWSGWLSPSGSIIVNTQEMYPMPVITGLVKYPDDIIEQLTAKAHQAVFLDALKMANDAGNAKSVNMVLLGQLSHLLPMAETDWLSAIEETVKAHTLTVNITAFKAGRAYRG